MTTFDACNNLLDLIVEVSGQSREDVNQILINAGLQIKEEKE